MELCLTLPWPPTLNHYKKVGRTITTKTGKIFQQRVNTNETKMFYFEVYIKSKAVIPPEWAKLALQEEIRYSVYVYLHPPNNRRYDLDNRLKALLDGLVRAKVIKDDHQISRLYVEKCNIIEQGQAIVRIQEIKESPPSQPQLGY